MDDFGPQMGCGYEELKFDACTSDTLIRMGWALRHCTVGVVGISRKKCCLVWPVGEIECTFFFNAVLLWAFFGCAILCYLLIKKSLYF